VILLDQKTENKQVLWKKLIKEILLKIPFHNYKNLKTNKTRLERIKFHRPFIEKEILKISKSLYNKKDLEGFVQKEKLNAVIVGSDQVWRKSYTNSKYYKNYFLDFVDGSKIKKIAYAASFGTDHWEGKGDEEDISKLLKDFTAVYTRESSGIQICRDDFKYTNAKHALDPTMLISKEIYIDDIISKYDTSRASKGGLVSYVLDEAEEKKEMISFIKNSVNIKEIHHLKGFNARNITYTIPEWLSSFVYADFVVTDSFHGMIYSIVFQKNFIVIGNNSRGLDRFISLLSLLNLEDRLVFCVQDIKDKTLDKIDYNRVNQLVDEQKNISFDYLIQSLNNNRTTEVNI